MEERLQKIIASAGLASRRRAEDLIREGRVRVNGEVVRELGTRVDPERDRIELDGEVVAQPKKVYYMLHKPPHVVTTLVDPEGRPHVGDLIRRIPERVVPVGRLDFDSEGLLILTNDGDAVYKMTHPKYGVLKTYHVKVKGVPDTEDIALLRRGITIDGKRTGPNQIEWLRNTRGDINSWWRVSINEGINRQVRKMFDRIEHPVQKLIRVQEGLIELGDLPRGAWRPLTPGEIDYIQSIGKTEPLLTIERPKRAKAKLAPPTLIRKRKSTQSAPARKPRRERPKSKKK